MSPLVWLDGKHTIQTAHCAVLYKMRKEEDILKKEDQYDHMMIQI